MTLWNAKAACALSAAALGLHLGCTDDPGERFLATHRAERGRFAVVVEGKGIVEPLAEVEIQTRISAKLARILEDGTAVKPGDVVAELESERIRSRLADSEANLIVSRAELKRQTAYADMRINSARYSTELAKADTEVARAQFENAKAGVLTSEEAKIQVAAAVQESEIERQDESRKLAVVRELRELGVEDEVMLARQRVQTRLADIDATKAKVEYDDVMQGYTEEELRESELKLRLAEHRLRAALKSLDDRQKSKKATVNSYQRQVKRSERYVARYQKELEQTVVKATRPGIVMVKSFWGRKLVPGRYVYRGHSIASLPDLSRLKVRVWVREQDAARLRTGQKAEITSAAYPGLAFLGKVHTVARLVKETAHDLTDQDRKRLPQGADRVMAVDVEVLPAEVALTCGASAHVRVFVEEHADAVYIPKSALRTRRRVLFKIDPEVAQHLVAGLAAEVSSPSAPDVVCRGVVDKVGRWGHAGVEELPSAETLPDAAEVSLEEVDDRLKPGAHIVVSVSLTQPAQRSYSPKGELRFEQMHFVLVRGAEGDEARRVEAGAVNAYWVHIKSGLQGGEPVVLSGAAS